MIPNPSSPEDDAMYYQRLTDRLHAEACQRGDYFYRDPQTGYIVFTRLKHEARGYCCKSGCRHCAYGYKKSPQPPLLSSALVTSSSSA